MDTSAHSLLMRLQKAKEEVKRLEAEYRKVCECNERIPGVVDDPRSYKRLFKTCKYHEVKIYHRGSVHAKV